INTHSTPGGGGRIDAPRFFNATTLESVAAPPAVQSTCGRRVALQPQLAGNVYRHQAYAGTFLFHNWRVETAEGDLLRTIDGLAAPFVNRSTEQAYAGGWALALPTLTPVGRLPMLTCIFDLDEATGRIYAQLENELVVLDATGTVKESIRSDMPLLDHLPPQPVTAIAPVADYPATPTIFVVQSNAIYRSTDGGAHWRPFATLPLHGVMPLHIALSPNYASDQTIFVGGGNRVGASDTLAGGIFRSTDGGVRWQALWNGLDYLRIRGLRVSPTYPTDQTVLAYADATNIESGFNGYAIQRSIDGGLSWSLWLTTTNEPELHDLPWANIVPPQSPAVHLNAYHNQLLRPTIGEQASMTTTWEAIDLQRTLGSAAITLTPSPDFAQSGVLYLLGEHALWRISENGAIMESWQDPRLMGRTAYEERFTTLAVSALARDRSYQ
ncbi:MAG: hypothetical protein KDE31_34915, partial [Caldilineaceae bacterium]|nr:hypothetical protein [Caldilineaceae bacterium]